MQEQIKTFRDLVVWQKAMAIVVAVYRNELKDALFAICLFEEDCAYATRPLRLWPFATLGLYH